MLERIRQAEARVDVMREALNIYEDIVKAQRGVIAQQRLLIEQLLAPKTVYQPGEEVIG